METFKRLLFTGFMTIICIAVCVLLLLFAVVILYEFYQLALGNWGKAPMAGAISLGFVGVIFFVSVGFIVERLGEKFGWEQPWWKEGDY